MTNRPYFTSPPHMVKVQQMKACEREKERERDTLGSSQTWLFQTWLFAFFTRKLSCLRSFAPFCALLRSFAFVLIRTHLRSLRSFACFCVRPRLERPDLGIAETLAEIANAVVLKEVGCRKTHKSANEHKRVQT